MISFTIPGKPVAQSRPRFARRGSFVTTYDAAPSRDYKAWVRLCAAQAMQGRAPIDRDTPLALSVSVRIVKPKSTPKRVEFPVKKPDLDNYIKTLMDAMEGIIYAADQQIVSITASKVFALADGVDICIMEA